MGKTKIINKESGNFGGAHAPALPESRRIAKSIDPFYEKQYWLVVPQGKTRGDYMTVTINDMLVSVKIPAFVEGRKPKGGDKFMYTHKASSQVISSTLPSIPGTVIVECKPIVFANLSMAGRLDQSGLAVGGLPDRGSILVQDLLQKAQAELLQKTAELGCNAVLSVQTNITIDSGVIAGGSTRSNYFMVTLTGTPCTVVPINSLPAIEAEAELVPSH